MAEDTPTDPLASESPTDPAPDPRHSLCTLPHDEHARDAGIINIKHGGCGGTVSLLLCKPGSVRARHWHRQDEHWLHVLSGRVEYFERPLGSTECPEPQVFDVGETFYTPPGVEHALRFPAFTQLISISSRTRTHEEHEADVVRVPFVLPGEE